MYFFSTNDYTSSVYLQITWACNGFDGVESRGECKQERYVLNSSKTIVANNNAHFEQRLAAQQGGCLKPSIQFKQNNRQVVKIKTPIATGR